MCFFNGFENWSPKETGYKKNKEKQAGPSKGNLKGVN